MDKKYTNRKLLDELITRGFFIIPTGLKNDTSKEINHITVSVTEPKNDVHVTYIKQSDKPKDTKIHRN